MNHFQLKFLGFSDSGIKSKYAKIYSDDKENTLLENWTSFEKDNPDTFNSMYNFWVKKII